MKYAKRSIVRKRRARRVGARTVSKGVRSYVKRAMRSNAETKTFIDFGANQSIAGASSSTAPTTRNLIGQIQQGVGKSQRVGNSVSVTSATIKGRVNILPYNSITNPAPAPVLIKMWLLSSIVTNAPAVGTIASWSSFFDINNSSIGFQNNPLDLSFPTNKDLWKVHATKQIKIGASAASNAIPSPNSFYDNSPMSAPFTFSYGKHIKTLKFDDTTAPCTNKNLYLLFQVVNADGSATALTSAEYHYVSTINFKDM